MKCERERMRSVLENCILISDHWRPKSGVLSCVFDVSLCTISLRHLDRLFRVNENVKIAKEESPRYVNVDCVEQGKKEKEE